MTTKAEKEWMDAIVQLGCIACMVDGKGKTPAEVHHLLSGGRRINHLMTIPLCRRHHRDGGDNKEWTSRHPWRLKFERRYGTEMELLEKTRELVMRREDFASRSAILEEAK